MADQSFFNTFPRRSHKLYSPLKRNDVAYVREFVAYKSFTGCVLYHADDRHASADSHQRVQLSGILALSRRTDLPGYCTPTFPPYTRRIYSHAFRMTIGLWILLPPRPDVVASYTLRVPRAGDLLTASSGPRLTAAALAVRLTVPVIRVRKGLAPPSECALPGAQYKRA